MGNEYNKVLFKYLGGFLGQMYKILFILFFIPSFSLADSGEIDLSLVSTKVEQLRAVLDLENKKTYITGGTALSILDHVLFLKPLKMKDIDVAVISPDIDEKEARVFSKKLSQNGNSKERDVVSKAWADGWGFFHTYEDIEHLLDLAIFPSEEILNSKNGILNIERVKIELNDGETLLSVVQKITASWSKVNRDLARIKELPGVVDASEGFKSWKLRSPKIVLVEELETLPVIAAMRIIRLHVKIDAELSPELKGILKENLKKDDLVFDRLRAARHFSYFFGDDRVADELSFASEIGLLKKLYPSIANYVAKVNARELSNILRISLEGDKKRGVDELRLYRLRNLVQVASVEERIQLQSQLSEFYSGVDLSPFGSKSLSCQALIS